MKINITIVSPRRLEYAMQGLWTKMKAAIASKADVSALSGKADASALAGKADAVHTHSTSQIKNPDNTTLESRLAELESLAAAGL